jgi:acyl-coenzyme A thioesterase PaaI-like protein
MSSDAVPAAGESLRTRLLRLAFNFYPCYRRTGGRITYIARDHTEVRVKLPLDWRTRGYWGTLFGGSMYGAIDPILVVMLARRLGPDYVVWDKAATIEFRRPGRGTLFARFRIEDAEIEELRLALAREPKLDRTFAVQLTDADGLVHAAFTKTLHLRRRQTEDRAEARAAAPAAG